MYTRHESIPTWPGKDTVCGMERMHVMEKIRGIDRRVGVERMSGKAWKGYAALK
jgi:hypothetical protein